MTATTTGRRSNRMYTQRVLTSLERFLLLAVDHDDRAIRKFDAGKAHVNYDTVIWELYYDGMFICNVEKSERGIQVLVTTGGYLDGNGNATRTTREFVNGVLDHLEGATWPPSAVEALAREGIGYSKMRRCKPCWGCCSLNSTVTKAANKQ